MPRRKPLHTSKNGKLIIIGGREDKTDSMIILREIAKNTGRGKMVVATIASEAPNEVWEEYYRVFTALGVKNISHFNIEQHDQALDPKHLELFKGVRTVFFSGGDQLKITTKIGGTPIMDRVYEIYQKGGVIAGTSAGAAIMGKTMLVGNEASEAENHKVGSWMMAPGLGFIEDILIDQHFAQRGRISRLLGAIALNPGVLGIGIDEDTAIIIDQNQFRVIGRHAVYVIDGRNVSYTNISEAAAEKTMSMHNVRLHILSCSDKFDIQDRKPFKEIVSA